MKLHRFVAPTTRLAMQQVREALGEDAIILSNKKKDNLIELVATIESSSSQHISISEDRAEAKVSLEKNQMDSLALEMTALKKAISQNLSGLAWQAFGYQHPHAVSIFNQLFSLGFSSIIAKNLVSSLESNWSLDTCWDKISQTLKNTLTVDPKLIDRGGIFTIFGPSGSGKTQATIKLGALYRLKNPKEKISFVSPDSARTGTNTHLSKFARILNADFMVCESPSDIVEMLKRSNAGFILIDAETSNSANVLEKTHKISKESDFLLRFILTLPLTHQSEILNRYIECHSRLLPIQLFLTKLDESYQIGQGLSIALERKLPICFYSKGVGVSEDMKPAHIDSLLRLSGLSTYSKDNQSVNHKLALDSAQSWKVANGFK